LVCWAGPGTQPQVVATAHRATWIGPGDDDYDAACEAVLRCHWESLLTAAGATSLRSRQDPGGWRFYAGAIPLHAGASLEVLGPDGRWIAGRFEYLATTSPWTPHLWIPLGGWNDPAALLVLASDAVVRIPADARR
jgi:hypothetical protein